jgi:hypothetical protein
MTNHEPVIPLTRAETNNVTTTRPMDPIGNANEVARLVEPMMRRRRIPITMRAPKRDHR